jgi:hypothetical protein
MNTCSSTMMPTATTSRTKRRRDDAHVPSLTEESLCGEINKRVHPNSVKNGTLSLQRLRPCSAQPPATMATLAVVEPEAMNATAPEAVELKQNERLVDSMDVPDAAYQPILSFLLNSTSVCGTASSLGAAMDALAVVEAEAMNSTAPEAVPLKQNERLVDFTDVPDAAYQPILSFLLDSTSGPASPLGTAMAALAVVEAEAMNFTAPEALPSKQNVLKGMFNH